MKQSYPAYQITYADLERLKIVASRVFGRGVSPASRMEIIARSSGFNTYASFLSSLKEGPVWITGDQSKEESFILKSGMDPSEVPFIHGISIAEIICAGLAWTERDFPEFAYKMGAKTRLDLLKKDGGTVEKYLELLHREISGPARTPRVFRSSLSGDDYRKFKPEETLIMLSPANQMAIANGTGGPVGVRLEDIGWKCAKVRLSDENEYFDLPNPMDVHWDSQEFLNILLEGARMITFDEDDRSKALKLFEKHGSRAIAPHLARSIKDDILYIDERDEGDLFTIGQEGATNCDAPLAADMRTINDIARVSMNFLCEVLMVSHSFGLEQKKLSFDNGHIFSTVTPNSASRMVVCL
jgi:hypothetical protein